MLTKKSNLHRRATFFDYAKLVEFPRPAPRTVHTCTLPFLFGSQIAVPKRPSPALTGAGSVNLAFSGHIIKENAVTIAEFLEAPSNPDLSCVLILEFLDWQINNFCDRLDFHLVDPDVSGSTRAAITTLATSEFESVLIPRFVGRFFGHRCLELILSLD